MPHRRTQFPLTVAYAITVHKFDGRQGRAQLGGEGLCTWARLRGGRTGEISEGPYVRREFRFGQV